MFITEKSILSGNNLSSLHTEARNLLNDASISLDELTLLERNQHDINMLQYVMDRLITYKNDFETVVKPSSSYAASLRKNTQVQDLSDEVSTLTTDVITEDTALELLESLQVGGAVFNGITTYTDVGTLTDTALRTLLTKLNNFASLAASIYTSETDNINRLRSWVQPLLNSSSLTADDRTTILNQIINYGNIIENQAQEGFEYHFWSVVNEGYKAAEEGIQLSYNTLNDEAVIFQNKRQLFRQAASLLDGLIAYFTLPGESAGGVQYIGPTELTMMAKTVEMISSMFPLLEQGQRQALNQGLGDLFVIALDPYVPRGSHSPSQVYFPEQTDLGIFIGAAWCYSVLEEILANPGSGVSFDEIRSRLSSRFGQVFNGRGLSHECYQRMEAAYSEFLISKSFFYLTGIYMEDNVLVSGGSGYIGVQGDVLPALTQVPSADCVAINDGRFVAFVNNYLDIARGYQIKENLATAVNNRSAADDNWQNEHYTGVLTNMAVLQNGIVSDRKRAVSETIKHSPLPFSIVDLLIKDFLPGEEDYLQGLVSELNASDYGSRLGNEILDQLLAFVNAASSFTFGSFLGSPVGLVDGKELTFAGNPSAARSRLVSEQQALLDVFNVSNSLLNRLNTYRSDISSSAGLTNIQKNRYFAQIQSYENELHAILAQIGGIKIYTDNLTIHDGTEEEKGLFKVIWGPDNTRDKESFGQHRWIDGLTSAENALAVGYSRIYGKGGLSSFYAQVHADQQAASDSGQTAQLNLQLQLTAMQQQWSLVATSLQVLNQMYLTCARSIIL